MKLAGTEPRTSAWLTLDNLKGLGSMKSWALAALAIVLPGITTAQPVARPAATTNVSLAQALDQAQRTSPTYRQVLNDAGAARWAVRSAYADLLVPSVNVGGGFGYTGSGSATFGGSLFNQSSPSLSSGYGLQLDWQFSGATLSGPGQQKATQNAIGEDINNALVALRYEVR